MATWIGHLRLAENLLERIPNLDAAQFAIGNLAPDSGVPDEKWEHFDPPKEVTHFLHHSASEGDIYDLMFYRGYLAQINPQDVPRFSFRLGYFFHLVADGLWSRLMIDPAKSRFAEQLKNEPDFVWKAKEDWYGLDFVYLRDHPNSLFWRSFLQAEPDAFDLDYIPKYALEQQLHYIKTFYQRQDEEIQSKYTRPYIYLSKVEMDAFVLDATEQIYRVYQAIWLNTPPDLTGKNSVFEIILQG